MEEEVKRLLAQRTRLENQIVVKGKKLEETLAEMDSDFKQYQANTNYSKNKYEKEKDECKQQAEAEISQIEADIDRKNSEIGLALREMRDELIAEVAHYKPDYSEKEKALKTKEIELKIAKEVMEEAEAEYNHRMMRFYYYDDKAVKSLDDSDVLSSRKDYNDLLVEFNSMLGELNSLKAKDEGVVKNLNSKIARINQFFGTVDIRKTSADKILDALEDEEFDVQIPLGTAQQPVPGTQASQPAPKKSIPITELSKSGIKPEEIKISQIDFDISTGKIRVAFTANKHPIEINVDMGNKLLKPREMKKCLKENNISIDGKMDPYIVQAIKQSAEEIMEKGLKITDKTKTKEFAEKYIDAYRNSLGANVDLKESKEEKVESLTGIRYFKSEEKCDKNNFKYLMPYMREAKESTCSNVEVDTRKWYEILRDGVKSIFNKTLGLPAGKQEPQQGQTQGAQQTQAQVQKGQQPTQPQVQQGQEAEQKNSKNLRERIKVSVKSQGGKNVDNSINGNSHTKGKEEEEQVI